MNRHRAKHKRLVLHILEIRIAHQRGKFLRDNVPLTRQHPLRCPMHVTTQRDLLNSDKAQLRATIWHLHAQGMSYRQIGEAVGLYRARIGQVLKENNHI